MNKPLIVRYAGGSWWLIKKDQTGEYIAPLKVNESAATIVKLLQDKTDAAAAAEILAEGDSQLVPMILSDIEELCRSLQHHFKVDIRP